MKKLILILVCTTISSTVISQEMEIKRIISDYVEAFNDHDLERLQTFYADMVVLEGPDGWENPPVAKTRIRDSQQGLFKAIPDVKDTVRGIIVDGHQACVELITSGNSVNGNTFRKRIITWFDFNEDLLIQRESSYLDTVEY